MNARLAWTLSLMFDLAGLTCAECASRAMNRGTPAGLARLAILGFVIVSGALNWSHGRQVGGIFGGLGFASISGAVGLLFELHRRDVRDKQRAARGLVVECMPHIPLLGWVMYPGRSWAALRGVVGARLDVLDPVQTARTSPVVERAKQAPGLPSQQTPAPQLPPPVAPQQPAPIVYRDPRCAAVRPRRLMIHHPHLPAGHPRQLPPSAGGSTAGPLITNERRPPGCCGSGHHICHTNHEIARPCTLPSRQG